MPQEIIDTHELETITLDYRRECQHDDMVDSLTSSEPEEILLAERTNGYPSKQHGHGSDHLQFLHFLRLSGTGLEINRGRTIWRKLIRLYYKGFKAIAPLNSFEIPWSLGNCPNIIKHIV
ncbi:Oleoyl-acyl carrier protein thioesterase, chloroplastic [Dendrobium catenatum]|uniref:Oleoyl-acyl carrier protein thioesterase, chloroplastic n=1 Tax=Dendrobium catenatum TaxID=906689 RepID=A0A2I0X9W6_9ASPA|nr:Oleoyl-acyl carrier protein thioesterase, chloroplastic [Dendrobium catenatum]